MPCDRMVECKPQRDYGSRNNRHSLVCSHHGLADQISLDRDAKDFETHDVSDHLNMNASPKVATLLPQGERIKSFFGIATALLNEPKLRPFDVSIAYQDLKRNTYTSKLSLDVAVLDWISWLEKSGE